VKGAEGEPRRLSARSQAGKVGHLYAAKTTPHMYVIDPAGRLAYQGGIDDKPTANPADIASAKQYGAGRAG
jgi:hypothetical protein